MLTGPNVILILKIAVSAVSVILACAVVAIATGRKRLHGRLNTAFAVLTLTAVLGLELIIRLIDPTIFENFSPETRQALRIHLYFAIPSALLVPAMWLSGWFGQRRLHLTLAAFFTVAWVGTAVTGLFFLPHQ